MSQELKKLSQKLAEGDEETRLAAIKKLEKIQNETSIPLLASLINDPSRKVRLKAVLALETIGGANVLQPLLSFLYDSDHDVRMWTSDALGHHPQAGPLLLNLLGDKQNSSQIRSLAAWGLHMQDFSEEIFSALLTAVQDEAADVRELAIDGLGHIGDARAVMSIISALNDIDSDVRYTSIHSLASFYDMRAVEPLLALLNDVDVIIREYAVMVLEYFEDPRIEAPLIQCLLDENAHVRKAAVLSLRSVGHDNALIALRKLLESSNDSELNGYITLSIEKIENRLKV